MYVYVYICIYVFMYMCIYLFMIPYEYASHVMMRIGDGVICDNNR